MCWGFGMRRLEVGMSRGSVHACRLAVTAAHMERDIFKAVQALQAGVRDATKAAAKASPTKGAK